MTQPTIDEYKKRQKNAHGGASSDAERLLQLNQLRQAGVAAANLTGNQYWDMYLSYLQGAIDQSLECKRAIEEGLADPAMVDHNEIIRLKIALQDFVSTISALRAAISLPRDLERNGEAAVGIIERIRSGMAD
jgi:hypothetical protein